MCARRILSALAPHACMSCAAARTPQRKQLKTAGRLTKARAFKVSIAACGMAHSDRGFRRCDMKSDFSYVRDAGAGQSPHASVHLDMSPGDERVSDSEDETMLVPAAAHRSALGDSEGSPRAGPSESLAPDLCKRLEVAKKFVDLGDEDGLSVCRYVFVPAFRSATQSHESCHCRA